MNKKAMIMGTLGAMALTIGSVAAFQFTDAGTDNILLQRLEGTWAVNPEISMRLNPRPDVTMPRGVQFRKDDVTVNKLKGLFPRFKMLGDAVFMGGTATMNGVDHWFLVMNENNDNKLVLFTPTRDGGAGEPHPVLVNMIVSRDQTKDLLFLGGVLARESATAYDRTGK